MIQNQETTIRYITERRCESGGYCFYRLDEPNAGDTFYALASLAMMDALPQDDEATQTYLHSFQRPDGSFPNVNVGHAVIRSLALLHERPAINLSDWILTAMTAPGDTTRPVESMSLFEPLFQLVNLCRLLKIPIPPREKDVLIRAVLGYRRPDTGFGQSYSSMIETSHALAILAALDNETVAQPSIRFLHLCEDPDYGFLQVPNTRPPFLEHIHAGVLACSMIGYRSPVLEPCGDFIRKCFRENGGYVRSVFGGSATLENTYLALDTFDMIEKMSKIPVQQTGCSHTPLVLSLRDDG